MKTLDEVISELPEDQQKLIQQRYEELLKESNEEIINSQARLAVQSFQRALAMGRQIKALKLQIELLQKERDEWRRVANLAGSENHESHG